MERKMHAFALCAIYRSVNAALLDYKAKVCLHSSSTNYNKVINVLKSA